MADQISVDSEEDFYMAVTKWINHDKEENDKKEKRTNYVARLYNHVRFPILDLNFLKSVALHNDLITSNTTAVVMVKEALGYHENPASALALLKFTHQSYNVLRRHQDITNLLHQTVATWDHISEQTHQKEVAGMGVSQGMVIWWVADYTANTLL